jgi:hypothetical protein
MIVTAITIRILHARELSKPRQEETSDLSSGEEEAASDTGPDVKQIAI